MIAVKIIAAGTTEMITMSVPWPADSLFDFVGRESSPEVEENELFGRKDGGGREGSEMLKYIGQC